MITIHCMLLIADSNKADSTKTNSGEAYTMGFLMPKQSN